MGTPRVPGVIERLLEDSARRTEDRERIQEEKLLREEQQENEIID